MRVLWIAIGGGQVRFDRLLVVFQIEQDVGVGEVRVAEHRPFDRRQLMLPLFFQQPRLESEVDVGGRLEQFPALLC